MKLSASSEYSMKQLYLLGWRRVSFAADCGMDESGELLPECGLCGDLYEYCDCPGPTEEGYEYEEFNEILYARKIDQVECSICNLECDEDDLAIQGELGIIPFALCLNCNAGIVDYVFQCYGTEDEDRPGANVVIVPTDFFEKGKSPAFKG